MGGLLVRLGAVLAIIMVLGSALWIYARGWAPNRDEYPTQGVSVTSDTGLVEWGTLAAQGADFAYIRAARGASLRDPLFAANWRGARGAFQATGRWSAMMFRSAGVALMPFPLCPTEAP